MFKLQSKILTGQRSALIFAVVSLSLLIGFQPPAQAETIRFSPKQGPFLQCTKAVDCHLHWSGAGRKQPRLVRQNLRRGQLITISNLKGTINWGGASGLTNPSSCAHGPGRGIEGIPKLIAIAQFTNNSNRVIDPGVPTPGGRGALLLRDFAKGVQVPLGATKLWVSFPDSRYTDNWGLCQFWISVKNASSCSDGKDNDKDGLVDFPADPGCSSPSDTNERGDIQCDNGKDDDGDGLTDYPYDHGCRSPYDKSERERKGAACDNGIDDDRDGKIDYPADKGCVGPRDNRETQHDGPDCDDNKDNDGDGKVDYPQDPGCASALDNTETNKNGPACDDGIDNDGDGKTDFPRDPGCASVKDTNERDPRGPACDNGKDDDRDGFVDFPHDPGCSGIRDNRERDVNGPDCDNGKDDDRDGNSDYPSDKGCESPFDTTEKDPKGPACDNGRDDDGDGLVDYPEDPGCTSARDKNEFHCNPGESRRRSCDSGLPGICERGFQEQLCGKDRRWAAWSECKPSIEPGDRAEICNNRMDDDCDGVVDTKDSDCHECQSGTLEKKRCWTDLPGICEPGFTKRFCHDGGWSEWKNCVPDYTPGAVDEICFDEIDNDCDGLVDTDDPDCHNLW